MDLERGGGMRFPVEDLKITEIRHKQSAFGLDLELALPRSS